MQTLQYVTRLEHSGEISKSSSTYSCLHSAFSRLSTCTSSSCICFLISGNSASTTMDSACMRIDNRDFTVRDDISKRAYINIGVVLLSCFEGNLYCEELSQYCFNFKGEGGFAPLTPHPNKLNSRWGVRGA